MDGGGGMFVYKNFSANLPWYGVSLAALVVAAIAAFAPLSTLGTLRHTVMRR